MNAESQKNRGKFNNYILDILVEEKETILNASNAEIADINRDSAIAEVIEEATAAEEITEEDDPLADPDQALLAVRDHVLVLVQTLTEEETMTDIARDRDLDLDPGQILAPPEETTEKKVLTTENN